MRRMLPSAKYTVSHAKSPSGAALTSPLSASSAQAAQIATSTCACCVGLSNLADKDVVRQNTQRMG